jgi:predicted small lipoprotein YifL
MRWVVAAATVLGLAGCGSSSGNGVSVPQIGAARQFTLSGFSPTTPVTAGKPFTVRFTVKQPDGQPLTQYKTGPGPHTGVHLIIVRKDLAYIVHQHPPITKSGLLTQRITLPAPGPYRVLVDIYPDLKNTLPNFQLFGSLTVKGAYHPIKLPPYSPNVTVDGYHFHVVGHANIHAIQATFLHVNVTDSHGKPVVFKPWFGALAHAIFFHEGSLDYFHTHICAPDAPNCGTLPGVQATKITGSSPAPGKLTAGVLLALPGTWRLFLQMKPENKVITAPFTLHVK